MFLKHEDLMAIIRQYVHLQEGLITELRRKFPDTKNWDEWSSLREIPRDVELDLDHRKFIATRHGHGFSFVESGAGTTINAHELCGSGSNLVDSHRILEFLLSIGVTTVASNDEEIRVDRKSIGSALDSLCAQGKLRRVKEGSLNLYRID